jgi:glycosyltransferase involved in cell wall biosynthesis
MNQLDSPAVSRAIILFDMSYTLSMIYERQLDTVLESRKLGGYFDQVLSVHPLAGLFDQGAQRFGSPKITKVDDGHLFVEGKIGMSRFLTWIPPLNLLLAQAHLCVVLFGLVRTLRVNVVRVGDPYYLGLLGLIFSWLLKVPLVVRVCFDYDLLFMTSGKPVFPRLFYFRRIEKLVERFVFPQCDMVAGANQRNLRYAIANGAKRAAGVVFAYGNLLNPVHLTEPAKRGSATHLREEFRLHGAFLATVGRLEKMKQPEDNLYALRELRENGHEVSFIFVGDGSMRQELATLAKELGVLDCVRFAGNRSQEFVSTVLCHAVIVLSPHMGRALVEACLAGAPIVAYDYDWQGEIIHSGETGELVENGNWRKMAESAKWLIENPKIAAKYGSAARQLALETMAPERVMDNEIRAYKKLFGI